MSDSTFDRDAPQDDEIRLSAEQLEEADLELRVACERDEWRHGHRSHVVFKHPNGAFYRFTVDVHHSEGYQPIFPLRARRVVPRQVMTTVYERPSPVTP